MFFVKLHKSHSLMPASKNETCADIVIHHKNAISPPDDEIFEQCYIQNHPIEHNLVIEGSRTFNLINPKWDEPHHVIFSNHMMGALKIPIGTYHRSESGHEAVLF